MQLKFLSEAYNESVQNVEKSSLLSNKDDESGGTSSVIQTESILYDKSTDSNENIPDKQMVTPKNSQVETLKIKEKSETNSHTNNTDNENMINYENNSAGEEILTNSSHLTIPSLNLNSFSLSSSEVDKEQTSENSVHSKKDDHPETAESPVSSPKSEESLGPMNDVQKANKVSHVDKFSSISHDIEDNLSIVSSVHTHLDLLDSSKSLDIDLNKYEANAESTNCPIPLDSEIICKSPSVGISQLYLEESAIDPPLQLNAELQESDLAPGNSISSSSSVSEEIIKLDIRGQATANLNFPYSGNIFFSNQDCILTPLNLNNLMGFNSIPRMIVDNQNLQNDEKESDNILQSQLINENYPEVNEDVLLDNEDSKSGNGGYEQDFDIEEMIINQSKDIPDLDDGRNKPNIEGEFSMSTITTDYKTFHEDFQHKVTLLSLLINIVSYNCIFKYDFVLELNS